MTELLCSERQLTRSEGQSDLADNMILKEFKSTCKPKCQGNVAVQHVTMECNIAGPSSRISKRIIKLFKEQRKGVPENVEWDNTLHCETKYI